MDISNRGLELIKEFEGLELEAYQDIVGIWTIGYGHTSMAGPPDVVPGMEITEEEATEILRRDLGQYENGVESAVKVDINQNMFDALVSCTFNIGVSAMKKSTFIKRLNQGDYVGCAEAMQWWNKAGGQVVAGLKRRREAEAALFLEGYEADQGVTSGGVRGAAVEENSPRRGNLAQSRTVSGATTAGGAGAIGAGSVLLRQDDEAAAETQPIETTDENNQTTNEAAAGTTTEAAGDGEAAAAGTEQPGDTVFVSRFDSEEAWDAVVIAAGVVAVIAAIYVILVRFDDWRNHKR